MNSKTIEQAIEELYDFVDMCKAKGFSGTQIIVQKEELLDKLDELKALVPDEIERCKKLIDRRDEIIKGAELKAQKIMEEAERQAEILVHDSEIMRQAYVQANEYVNRATQEAQDTMGLANYEAEQIRTGAYDYTKEMLLQVENVLSATLSATKAKSEEFINALTKNLEIVMANRKELMEDVAPYDEESIEDKIANEQKAEEEPYKDQGLFATDDDEDYNTGTDTYLYNN